MVLSFTEKCVDGWMDNFLFCSLKHREPWPSVYCCPEREVEPSRGWAAGPGQGLTTATCLQGPVYIVYFKGLQSKLWQK